LHLFGKVDDDLFPHRSAETVSEVVHLIHHDESEVFEQLAMGIEHVAQHLGGHDDHARVGVDAGISGEQPNLVVSVHLD